MVIFNLLRLVVIIECTVPYATSVLSIGASCAFLYCVLMQKKPKLLVIVGPTSSGKSALAVSLARKFKGEVISADSRQVYKGLDIGTGKITKREMRGVSHHLLDVASPKKLFTAHDFKGFASQCIAQIASRNKLPIVTGGTGFFIDALVGRISLPNVPINLGLRDRLEKKTAEQLFLMLKKRDPERAKTIDRHNRRRLVRALEIVYALGKVPKNNDLVGRYSDYDVLWIGISLAKPELDKNISMRLFARIRGGMVAEARRLHANGLSYKRMDSLGLEYRWLALLLQKKISRGEFEDMLLRDIRRYAKRQITYWKRNKEIRWFNPRNMREIYRLVSNWVKN